MLARKIQQMLTFFSLLVPDMTNEEEQMLDEALIDTYRLNGRCPVRILGQYEYNIRRYACHRHCSCHLYCHTYCQAQQVAGVAVQAAAEL